MSFLDARITQNLHLLIWCRDSAFAEVSKSRSRLCAVQNMRRVARCSLSSVFSFHSKVHLEKACLYFLKYLDISTFLLLSRLQNFHRLPHVYLPLHLLKQWVLPSMSSLWRKYSQFHHVFSCVGSLSAASLQKILVEVICALSKMRI